MYLHRSAFTAARNTGLEDGGDVEDRIGVAWTSDSIPVTTRRSKMVHFSITSLKSYSLLGTEPEPIGNTNHQDKKASQVATVATVTN